MSAIELLRGGDEWTDVTTRIAFPIVLASAMGGDPITYGDLNHAVHMRGEPLVMALTYRYVAGKVGDVCEALVEDLGHDVPLLNAIIVSKKSGLPSHGVDSYLAKHFGMTPREIKRLNKDERDSYAQSAMEQVFNFTGWNQIGRHLKISKTVVGSLDSGRGEPIPTPNRSRFAGGPESALHKKLKDWVVNHPDAVSSFGKFGKGKSECWLASGDRLDVLFTNAKTRLAVEVKTSEASDDEVQRGIFQCVKYRATLRAMQLAAAEPPNAQAVLVIDCRPTSIVRLLAERLSVKIVDVSKEFDERR
ncbi:hypothetical protein [Bradyrhizobium prioriisuperbiae]|uniref:hypothetical protein n=1 Tax=Bradyrhizobium prioriisuperbiae TaxID=2854389 RepID=UPI0028EE2F33|nr:hypothetical protein [Bradyrhizobium prioritasuperba]